MSDLIQRVEANILERKLFKPGASILVAVSGGMDSMVLLHLLAEIAPRHRWQLTVAHFNHQLRGRSSDADERLVRKTARRLKLKCMVESADVRSFAADMAFSIEMAARATRHAFLAGAAVEHGAKVIALAHHADDQVELFFLRLLRGAGSQGLAGMSWQNPSSANRRVELARPLLDCTKSELAAYAKEHRIAFREDATNISREHLRNRARHELLPLLTRHYQPALRKTVLRQMEILRAESDYLQELAEKSRKAGGTKFAQLPVALQRRVLQMELHELNVAAEFDLVERLRLWPGQPTAVGPHLEIAHDGQGKVRKVQAVNDSFSQAGVEIELTGRQGEGNFGGLKWNWRVQAAKECSMPKFDKGCEWFDGALLGAKVIIRHWLPGDRFQPSGMKKPSKLQDLFTNSKIPCEARRGLVVATTADGQIWWVEGLRIGERFKLGPATRRRFKWNWRRRQ